MDNPTIADFKTYFTRDFPFGATDATVMDADITKAFSDTDVNINASLFADQAAYTIGYLNLAAHFLVTNLRASSQGIAGKFSWLSNSKGVGSVSESVTIPERITNDPRLSIIATTSYGVKYLFMILPYLYGNILIVSGGTNA